jgi:hypothetical protein
VISFQNDFQHLGKAAYARLGMASASIGGVWDSALLNENGMMMMDGMSDGEDKYTSE